MVRGEYGCHSKWADKFGDLNNIAYFRNAESFSPLVEAKLNGDLHFVENDRYFWL